MITLGQMFVAVERIGAEQWRALEAKMLALGATPIEMRAMRRRHDEVIAQAQRGLPAVLREVTSRL